MDGLGLVVVKAIEVLEREIAQYCRSRLNDMYIPMYRVRRVNERAVQTL